MTIRTRFAPSPTGYLHVGGLRTALYNYLYARQHGGEFILRIEDTDQTRYVEGAVEKLLSDLAWVGLDYDEGPFVEGSHGPYVQSQRLATYREHVRQLADLGHAYPCFCSKDTLGRMQADQTAAGLPPMYDRRCRKLSQDEARKKIESGESHVWRMAIPLDSTVIVHDLIRGEVRTHATVLDDQVLLKSDGFPTYHLANVVDDHLMEITHVIRGEEWLPSTPKHVLLYQFFGWEAPQFAHLPLLLNPDRSKMSKRSGDVAVEEFRNHGILPEVLINFVALLGWHPQDEREIFSISELIREFSLERVNKAGAVFDTTKLRWLNSEYLRQQSDELLFDRVRDELAGEIETQGETRVRYAIAILRGGIDSYAELVARVKEVFGPLPLADPEMQALLDSPHAKQFVSEMLTRMSELDLSLWNSFEQLEKIFKEAATECGQQYGLKGKTLWRTLRAALSGQPHGPELGKLVGIWGRERVCYQLALVAAPNQKPSTV